MAARTKAAIPTAASATRTTSRSSSRLTSQVAAGAMLARRCLLASDPPLFTTGRRCATTPRRSSTCSGSTPCQKVLRQFTPFVPLYHPYHALSGNFGGSFYVAATSSTPEGPFAVQNSNMTMAHTAPGDFDLFVDDDGTGYIIYTSVNEVSQQPVPFALLSARV